MVIKQAEWPDDNRVPQGLSLKFFRMVISINRQIDLQIPLIRTLLLLLLLPNSSGQTRPNLIMLSHHLNLASFHFISFLFISFLYHLQQYNSSSTNIFLPPPQTSNETVFSVCACEFKQMMVKFPLLLNTLIQILRRKN